MKRALPKNVNPLRLNFLSPDTLISTDLSSGVMLLAANSPSVALVKGSYD
jgi:hypothetical protein